MELTLVEHRRSPNDDLYNWCPYEHDPEFTDRWWVDREWYLYDEPWCWQVFLDGHEVARVELDRDAGINPEYANTPTLGNEKLEIQFIEVAESRRGQGIGKSIVAEFARRFSKRRFLAYSQDADQFWASLGWERFDHPEGPRFHRPLFIQPAS